MVNKKIIKKNAVRDYILLNNKNNDKKMFKANF